MVKAIVLNYEFPPLGGGASPVSFEITKRLSKEGFDIDVVTMGYQNLKNFEKINNNFRIHRVKAWRSKKEICHPWEQLTYLFSAFWLCRKLIKVKKFDFCYCHFIIPTGILALIFKKLYGLEYIVTSHGSDVPGFNSDRFKLLHKFTGPMLRAVCKNAQCVTTPSRFLADLIKKNIGNYEIIVMPNGSIDFLIKGIEKKNIIFSSGRLLERKGFQYLVEAFNGIEKKDWRLIIAGDGPYGKELEKIIAKDKRISLTGWLDNKSEEYMNLFNEAKIFALLSKSESQGIVYIEAMSAGCAIMASNDTACSETVGKEVGFLVKRENIDEIKEKLSEMIANEKLLENFMKNSRIKYEIEYVWDKIIKKYIELFKEKFQKND